MTVQHIVWLRFNDGVAEDERVAALDAVAGLQGRIDGIEKVETGADLSGRGGGFTHAAIVTMRDRTVLDAYGPHPAHKEVQARLEPVVAELRVIDIEPP